MFSLTSVWNNLYNNPNITVPVLLAVEFLGSGLAAFAPDASLQRTVGLGLGFSSVVIGGLLLAKSGSAIINNELADDTLINNDLKPR